MQNTSDIYKALLNKPDCAVRTRLTIGGKAYSGPILNISTHGGLFSGQTPSVGCCVSREIDLGICQTMEIPRMAEIRVEVKLALLDLLTGEETEASEWVPKGTFFIDTRLADSADNSLTIHGYDAMLKAEQIYLQEGDTGEWPRPMPEVVADIAARMGVEIDTRTVLNASYMVDYPNDLTMREILGYIAAAHAGNWIITDAGALRLVSLYNPAIDTLDFLCTEDGEEIIMGGVRILV